MSILLLLFLIFYIYYTYISSAKGLSDKVSKIQKAIKEGKDTYMDEKYRMRSTETGEIVVESKVFDKWPPHCKERYGAVDGDVVLYGAKTYRVYRNYTHERYLQHIQRQLDAGKVWCFERKSWSGLDKRNIRFHMNEKYIYYLDEETTQTRIDWCKYDVIHKYYLYKLINGTYIKQEIDKDLYKELGGK